MKKINIPELAPMYYQVRDALKELQGDKGYVDTSDWGVWAYIFNSDGYVLEEKPIKAIKVDEDSVYIFNPYLYSDEMGEYNTEDDWWDIWDDDSIYFIPTLFRIADAINDQII